MADLEHAREMLFYGQRDLQALGHMLDPAHFPEEVFGLLAQQAVEKALKAWLSIRGLQYPHKHDLRLLYRMVEESGEPAVASFRDLVPLTDFGVRFRYGVSDTQPLDRAATVDSVTSLVGAVQRAIEFAEASG